MQNCSLLRETMLLCVFLCMPLSAQDKFQFADATAASKLLFTHDDGDPRDQGLLPSMMGSGLATFDYDNDGRIDVYFLNGSPLEPATTAAARPTNAQPTQSLLRNVGNGQNATFINVSTVSHTDLRSFGLGIAVADYDNDGFADAAISNFGSVSLLHNNGDGTFNDVSTAAGLNHSGVAFGAGIAFLDIENDGDVDLYVADYVDFTIERFKSLAQRSYPYPPGPEQFEHRADHLFINGGDGVLFDGSQAAGIAAHRSPSMGIVCGDFDNDHDTDIFVCSDARPNLYFVNDGHGVFKQDAQLQAVALNARGIPVGAMGAEAADLDNDVAEDIFVTTYSTQLPLVYKNLGEFGFEDVALATRAGRDIVPHAKWGVGAVDFDNDGDRDLMIANGHLFKWAHDVEQLTDFKVRNTLLANNGKGIFRNATDEAGPGLSIIESSRGLAFDDLDNDGDVDCVVSNNDAAANFLQNDTLHRNHWVEFRVIGTHFNRDGIGAKVTVYSGDLMQVAEVHSGRAYQSHYGTRLHFGLGARNSIDRVTVDWLGQTSEYRNLASDRMHTLRE